MKILFVSQNYFPQLSGVPVVVRYLAEGLVHKGYEVSVVTTRRGDSAYRENICGVNVYRYDIDINLFKRPIGSVKEYIDFVCNFVCDVIIIECTQCVTCDLLLPYLGRIRAKKILHAHGFSGLSIINNTKIIEQRDGFKHTIGHSYNWIRSWFYFKKMLPRYINLFDASMVLSNVDSAKEYLDFYLGDKNFVLENAAEDVFFCEYSTEPNPLFDFIELKSTRYCFSCANYSNIKNQKQMIEQFYKADIEDLALVCIGSTDNEYYYECKALINELEKKYGKREIHLLHHIPRAYISLIESNAFIYLVSSLCEAYSISIIEAMTQGVPFISTNVGNACTLPGGLTIHEIDAMHQVIRTLVSDSGLYSSLSAKGKKYAYNHNRRYIAVNNLENIILQTVHK